MWNPILLWSLKAGVLLSLLYAGYFLLFRNNTHFRLRRGLLLALLIISIVWPLIKIQPKILPLVTPYTDYFMALEGQQMGKQNGTDFNHFEESRTNTEEASGFSAFNTPILLWRIYLLGIGVSLVIFLIEIFRLLRWVKTGSQSKIYGSNVIEHKSVKYPFSFWKWIFVPVGAGYEESEWLIIKHHEQAHLNKRHTIDLLLSSLMQCFLWYHPSIYMLQKAVKNNHEAEADSVVLRHTSFKAYSQTLLALSMRANTFMLGHSFALISSLSKRIKTMKMKRTKNSTTWAALCSFTVLLGIVASQTATFAQEKENPTYGQSIAPSGANVYMSLGLAKVTKDSPDLTMMNKRTNVLFKAVFPFKYLSIAGKIKDTYYKEYSEDEITFTIELSDDKRTYYEELLNVNVLTSGSKTEFLTELSEDELEDIYIKSKAATEKTFFQGAKNLEAIGFDEFKDQKFLLIKSYIHPKKNPEADEVETKLPSLRKIYKAKQVDSEAIPISGIKTFTNNVALITTKNSSLNREDIPDNIEFEFVVTHYGMVNQLNLKTKVKGNDQVQEMLYELMGQLNKNILEVSRKYGWKPAMKDNQRVSSWVTLVIPKSLL